MKMATLILTALLSTTAFAATSTVYHDYDSALRGIELTNACLTATEVKTIQATKNCVQLEPVTRQDGENTVTDWVCKKWQTSTLVYPRSFTRTFCSEYSSNPGEYGNTCVKWSEKSDFLPKTIKISVVTSNGEADNFPGVQSNFTFPSCQ